MSRVLISISALCLVLAAACAGRPTVTASPTAASPTPSPPASPPPTASLTPTTSPPPTSTPSPPPTTITLPPASVSPSAGPPSAGCIEGWQSPAAGSALYAEAVSIIDAHVTFDVPLTVEEMRYFRGPDVPWIIEPHYESVERWYVRTGGDMPAGAGRWLIEKRTDTIKGVSAVAPYDTAGYGSPDWTGFVGDGPPTAYPDLPGVWSGIAYDFVTGENDSGNPGLPDEVVDCLAGT